MDYADWIGRSTTRLDIATPRLLAEFRATLKPWAFDGAEDEAPPGFHFGLAPATPDYSDTGEDGAEAKGLFLPPIPFRNRMWAGGAIESLRPIRPNRSVTRQSTITDVREKQGTSGHLVLLSVRHDITDEEGLLIRERQDLVFRDGGLKSAVLTEAAPPDADWQVEASPLMLFRFSAFTFNGHRIHYDPHYAEDEGYPGLLVHGPLQATLMLNLLSVKLGAVPRHFEYRCLATLHGGTRFGVRYAATDDGAMANVIRDDGVTTAEGRVRAPGTG